MTAVEYDILNYIRLKGSMEKGTVYSSFPYEQLQDVRAALNACVASGLLRWSSPVYRSGSLSLTDKGRLALVAEDERRADVKSACNDQLRADCYEHPSNENDKLSKFVKLIDVLIKVLSLFQGRFLFF